MDIRNVTVIDFATFVGCASLRSVEIPDTVTTIGNSAFEGCTSLTKVDIPSSVTSIGDGAFSRCAGLTRVDLSSATSIGRNAFSWCANLLDVFYSGTSGQDLSDVFPAETCENGVAHVPMEYEMSTFCGITAKCDFCLNRNIVHDKVLCSMNHLCADADLNHICDESRCGMYVNSCYDSRDLDEHQCDIADCSRKVSGACWDSGDAGHGCNECGQVLLGECVDDDCDHYCDFCPIQLTTCNDARDDIDHLCDLCGVYVEGEACWDNTSLELDVDGHTCNALGCGKQIDPSVKDFCWDYDKDGKCEECGWVIGSPVVQPTAAPTVEPTAEPTVAPTAAPTVEPTVAPTVAPTAEPAVAPTVAPVAPKYEVKVDGKHGSIVRVNDTSVYYKDTYIRYSIGYDMGGTSYAVIAMLKVDWTETQEGVVGAFAIPRIQGSGTVTGASYIMITNENADGLSLAGTVKNSCGMLIQ